MNSQNLKLIQDALDASYDEMLGNYIRALADGIPQWMLYKPEPPPDITLTIERTSEETRRHFHTLPSVAHKRK